MAMYGQGATRGRVALLGENIAINQACVAIISKNNSVLPLYLYQLLYYEYNRVRSFSQGGNQANLSSDLIKSIPVILPPPDEQKKIAEILSTWDQAIEQTRKLLEAKISRKKALMQQLLIGKKRLPGFSEEWKVFRMGDLMRQIFRPVKFNDKENYKLISVRRRSGGIFFRGNISGHNILTKQLYLARKGDFLISKMQIVHGASALVTEQFDGMHISGSYIALEVAETKKLDINFLNWLSKTPYFYHLTYLSSYGVHIEKMTFNLRFFLKSEIKIPNSLDEQFKITEVLSTLDKEIDLLDQKLSALEKQKRGLMQKLLTGEVRVTM
jgi:type I restriction enzyme S subunit